jgi:hypothetical protein
MKTRIVGAAALAALVTAFAATAAAYPTDQNDADQAKQACSTAAVAALSEKQNAVADLAAARAWADRLALDYDTAYEGMTPADRTLVADELAAAELDFAAAQACIDTATGYIQEGFLIEGDAGGEYRNGQWFDAWTDYNAAAARYWIAFSACLESETDTISGRVHLSNASATLGKYLQPGGGGTGPGGGG